MNLYELTARYRDIADLAFDESDEDGRIDREFVLMMSTLEGDIKSKLASLCRVVREMEANAESAKAEAAMLSAKRSKAEAHAVRIKRYMKESLESLGETKFKVDDVFTLAIQASPPSVNVVDFDAVPSDFDKPIVRQLDVSRIRDVLKNGDVVPGCVLHRGDHLRIR